jgi:hypothetical protein
MKCAGSHCYIYIHWNESSWLRRSEEKSLDSLKDDFSAKQELVCPDQCPTSHRKCQIDQVLEKSEKI